MSVTSLPGRFHWNNNTWWVVRRLHSHQNIKVIMLLSQISGIVGSVTTFKWDVFMWSTAYIYSHGGILLTFIFSPTTKWFCLKTILTRNSTFILNDVSWNVLNCLLHHIVGETSKHVVLLQKRRNTQHFVRQWRRLVRFPNLPRHTCHVHTQHSSDRSSVDHTQINNTGNTETTKNKHRFLMSVWVVFILRGLNLMVENIEHIF